MRATCRPERAHDTIESELTNPASRVGRMVHHAAWRLIGTPLFSRDDLEDVAQCLRTAVLAAAPDFDPSRSSPGTFVNRVIRSARLSLLRHRRAQRRHPDAPIRTLSSIDEATAELCDGDRQRHRGVPYSPCNRQLDLASDVTTLLENVSPAMQLLARLLMSGSERNAARALEITRHELRQRIRALRRHFERHDLTILAGNRDQ